ncbi:MAG: TonB-dependent receptor, partial [Gemmatimonadaceae bacterium]|nr:TonB-dependent receptor [Gemmatimonadaceae bacterium]
MVSVRAATASPSENPLLEGLSYTGANYLRPESRQSLAHYTVGGTTTWTPRGSGAWTHALTGGLDGYRLSALTVDFVPVPTALDSALRSTRGGADRVSLRGTSVRRAGLGEHLGATITFAGDAALLRDATSSALPVRASYTPPAGVRLPRSDADPRWLSTLGTSVQATLSLRDAFFVTAGLRGERNDGFTNASRFAALPALGASLVRTHGLVSWKLRAAYGEGVRPARTPMRQTAWSGLGFGAVNADLPPERQAGVESGVDLYIGRALSLQVTRFDQRASSLIQQVSVAFADSLPGRPPLLAYRLENVGAITNRGWEFGARTAIGALALQGTLSLVQSRVARVAGGYSGDLRAGDRMLGVPARTAGLTATWLARGWQLQGGLTHVADWIGYDRLAVARDFVGNRWAARSLTGEALRAYWLRYDGITRVRLAVARELRPGLSLR